MIKKSVFLHVSGGDYSALDFENNFNPKDVYQQMVNEGKLFMVFDSSDYYIEVKIKEFENVNDNFLDFVQNELCDNDDLKHCNIYQVR